MTYLLCLLNLLPLIRDIKQFLYSLLDKDHEQWLKLKFPCQSKR